MFYQVCTKKITAFAAALLLLVCCPTIPAEAEGSSFQTNLEGWTGVESTWNTTDEGYCDGEEQTVEDFAVSNYTVDGTKSFVYTAEMERIEGYGFGIAFGAPPRFTYPAYQRHFAAFLMHAFRFGLHRNGKSPASYRPPFVCALCR